MGGVTTLRWMAVLIAAAVAAAAAAPAGSSPAPACHSAVHHGVLPTWARTGFSDPRPRLPHVIGRSDEIAALVFGYPLRSPEAEDRGNKILWVSRRALSRCRTCASTPSAWRAGAASGARSRASWWAAPGHRASTCRRPAAGG
jgi:hypothetical protein